MFAIPPEQEVIFKPMGRDWFIGGIFLMSLATWAFALMIERIVDLARNIRKKIWEVRNKFQSSRSDVSDEPHSRERDLGEDGYKMPALEEDTSVTKRKAFVSMA